MVTEYNKTLGSLCPATLPEKSDAEARDKMCLAGKENHHLRQLNMWGGARRLQQQEGNSQISSRLQGFQGLMPLKGQVETLEQSFCSCLTSSRRAEWWDCDMRPSAKARNEMQRKHDFRGQSRFRGRVEAVQVAFFKGNHKSELWVLKHKGQDRPDPKGSQRSWSTLGW